MFFLLFFFFYENAECIVQSRSRRMFCRVFQDNKARVVVASLPGRLVCEYVVNTGCRVLLVKFFVCIHSEV